MEGLLLRSCTTRAKCSLCRCRALNFAEMRLLFSTLFAGIVGLLAGFGWQWRPVAGPSLIERRTELTGALSEPAAPPDAAERFLGALQRKGDPLRIEHDLWMAVQSLDVADLRVVSADWAGVMAIAERSKDIPLNTQNALLAAVVEKWLTLDPNGAMTRLGELTTTLKDGDYIPEEVMAVLAKKQPQALVDFIIAAKAGTRRDGLAYQAAVALAGQHYKLSETLIALLPEESRRDCAAAADAARAAVDPEFGLARAAQPGWDGNRRGIIFSAGHALAKRGLDAVADALARNPQWQKSDRSMFLIGLIEQNPAGAAQLVADSPAENWSANTIRQVATVLAGRDTERAIAWAARLSGEARAMAEREIGVALAEKDPASALVWLARSSLAGDDGPRTRAFQQWLVSDEPAARAWLDLQPPGEGASFARAAMVRHLTISRRADEAARFLAPDDAKAVRIVADSFARADVKSAAEWAAALPPGTGQGAAMQAVVSHFANEDTDAAEQWVSAFPSGPARDHAARALVEKLRRTEPDRAGEWVAQIENRWQKTRAAVSLFDYWCWKDRTAAETWLRSVPDIYEIVRAERLSGL